MSGEAEAHAETLAVRIIKRIGKVFHGLVVTYRSELYPCVAILVVIGVSDENAVGGFVPFRIQVTRGFFFGGSQDELINHVQLDFNGGVCFVFELDLVVFFETFGRDKDADLDVEVVILGVESRKSLSMTRRGRNELFLVDEQHFGSVVAHHIVAPSGEFKLLGVEGKSKTRHGGADDTSETRIGHDVHPRHRGVGVRYHIVASFVVETSVLVVEVETAPYAELGAWFHGGILHLVLILLVDGLKTVKLLLDTLAAVETDTGDGVEQNAFVIADIVAVENEDFARFLMCRPKVFRVGNVLNEVGQPIVIVSCNIIDEDKVKHHAMNLIIFKGAKHFLCKFRTSDVVYFHQNDGVVATDAKTPKPVLRQSVLHQQILTMVAEGSCLKEVFGDVVVEIHL